MTSNTNLEGALAIGLHTQPTRPTTSAPIGQEGVNGNNHDVRPKPLLVQPSEAATLLAISRATLYELMAAGEIPSLKIGRSRRIPREAIEAFIAQRLAVQDDQ